MGRKRTRGLRGKGQSQKKVSKCVADMNLETRNAENRKIGIYISTIDPHTEWSIQRCRKKCRMICM